MRFVSPPLILPGQRGELDLATQKKVARRSQETKEASPLHTVTGKGPSQNALHPPLSWWVLPDHSGFGVVFCGYRGSGWKVSWDLSCSSSVLTLACQLFYGVSHAFQPRDTWA